MYYLILLKKNYFFLIIKIIYIFFLNLFEIRIYIINIVCY